MRLAHREPLSDEEIETVQEWALNEFSAGLGSDWEPNQRAKEADRLVGLVEQLKSTWR